MDVSRAVWQSRSLRLYLGGAFVAIGSCFAVGAYVGFVQPAIESERNSSCNRHLSIISMAMRNYADVYGCFPPAYVADDNGMPAHSWRVLLLPFLDRQDLYDRYDFNEPWDGPRNRRLAHELGGKIPIYNCPSDPSTWRTGGTNYVVVTGPGTAFTDANSAQVSDFVDGVGNTVLIVEVTGTDIQWMEPRDLSLETMDFTIGYPTGNNLSSLHPRRVHVLTAAGHVWPLSPGVTEHDIRGLLSLEGGEQLDWAGLAANNDSGR